MIHRIGIAATVALGLLRAAPMAEAREAWFAIIAGVNRPLQTGEKPLRFAGDDALEYYRFFRQFNARVEVFTELDPASRRYGARSSQAMRSPRKGALFAAFRRMNREMAELRRSDPSAVVRFFFVFSGHGGEDARGGYLNVLSDDESHAVKLTKLELWRDVLAVSHAARNHVIIDACSSGSFVTANDSAGRPQPFDSTWRRFLRRTLRGDTSLTEALRRTTFFVSSDALVRAHEDRELQGGVFTHELLSALRGAADIDGDGRITYPELRAFFAAANARFRESGVAGVRLEPRLVIPGSERERAFVRYEQRAESAVSIEKSLSGHFFVADERTGRRYAEFHKTAEYPVRIVLLPGSRYSLFYEGPNARLRLPIGASERVVALGAATRVGRPEGLGPVEEALSRLFETPLEAQAAAGARWVDAPSTESFLEQHLQALRKREASRKRWRYALYAVGAAAAATAVTFGIDAIAIHQRIMDARTPAVDIRGAVTEHRYAVYASCLGLGAAAASLLTGWIGFREEAADAPHASASGLRSSLAPGPGKAGLSVVLRY
jgi:hypothetical protein